MKEIVQKTLAFYFQKMRQPEITELWIDMQNYSEKWCCFVTLYLDGEVHGSAGNIKEIHSSLAEELVSNTIAALKDSRFTPLTLEQSEKIQFRVDSISQRTMIHDADIKKLDPVKDWILAIERAYNKLAVVLPNMSPKLLTGSDFIPVLEKKLSAKNINEKNYIFYALQTTQESTF